MEDYKKILKKREMLYLIFGILLIPVVIATLYLFYNMDSALTGNSIFEFFGGMLNGIRAGFGVAVLIFLFIRAFQYHGALKDENKIKTWYIEEHDERTIALNQIASKISFNIIMYTLLIACVITGFINSIVSLTLLAVLLFVILSKLLVYIKYARRM